MRHTVTVAICSWNRPALLRQTLGALGGLCVRPDTRWDLLIVNNGCAKSTTEVCRAFAGTLPIREVREPRLGLSHARNAALDQACGDYVLWTDDDVLPDPHWLEAFLESTERHPAASAFGGRVDPWFQVPPDPDLLEAFPALRRGFCGLDHGPEEIELPPGKNVFGANMAFAMSAIRDMRFDPNLGRSGRRQIGGEELKFVEQLRARGGRVVWCPAMRLRHLVAQERATLSYLQRFYFGVGQHEVILGGIPSGTRLLGVPRWLLRRYVELAYRELRWRSVRRRVQALVALRERKTVAGMIAASVRLRWSRAGG